MLVIRFTKIGKKNQPSCRIIVIDKRRSSSAGKCLEILGTYSPLTKKKTFKSDRIKYWISKGAQPSVSVRNLLISAKIIEGKKKANHSVKKSKKEVGVGSGPAAPIVSNTVTAPIIPPASVTPEPVKETPKVEVPVSVSEPAKEEPKLETKTPEKIEQPENPPSNENPAAAA